MSVLCSEGVDLLIARMNVWLVFLDTGTGCDQHERGCVVCSIYCRLRVCLWQDNKTPLEFMKSPSDRQRLQVRAVPSK
jgi:hypothetical protein